MAWVERYHLPHDTIGLIYLDLTFFHYFREPGGILTGRTLGLFDRTLDFWVFQAGSVSATFVHNCLMFAHCLILTMLILIPEIIYCDILPG